MVIHSPNLLAAGIFSSIAILSGCSSLERSGDLASHKLVGRVSTKSDAVNAIGLPQDIRKDDARGLEVWLYTGKPISTSYFVPIPVAAVPYSPGLTTIYYADVGSKNLESGAPVVLVLVFDRDGQLIEVQDKSK